MEGADGYWSPHSPPENYFQDRSPLEFADVRENICDHAATSIKRKF
jgi:hypothetical protein